MSAMRAERELASKVRACVASAAKCSVLPLALVDWEATTNEASSKTTEDESQVLSQAFIFNV